MPNTAPVAVADSFSTHHGTPLNVNAASGLLANDTDADNDGLNVPLASVTTPSHGSVSVYNDGSFTYYPNSGYVGSDSFQYRANDGTVDGNLATVTINVTNAAPSAVANSYHVNSLLESVSAPGVLGNDSDSDGDTLTAVLVSNVSYGSLTLNSDGSFSYTPNTPYTSMPPVPLYTGSDSFSYKPFDGAEYGSTVTVSLTDTAPVSVADSFLIQGGAVTGGVLGNDSDPDGDSITAVLVSNPSHGTLLSFNPDGTFSYSRGGTTTLTDSFSYRTFDGAVYGNTVTVTLTAPTLTVTGTTLSAVAGISTGLVTVASFTDTDQSSIANTAANFTAVISWADGTTSTADVTNGGITASGGGFVVKGTHTYTAYGSFPVGVVVTDNYNGISNGATTTATVTGQITLDNPGTQTDYEGDDIELELEYTAPSNSVLSWLAAGLPPGLSIDPGTGVISGEIPVGAHLGSTYYTSVSVTDGVYSASTAFDWIVETPITVIAPADQEDYEGDSVSVFVDADTNVSGTVTFAAGGLPPGLSINPNTGEITGVVAIGAAADSPYTVTVSAAVAGYSDSDTFEWTVFGPLTIDPIPDQVNEEFDSISLQVEADTTGPDPIYYNAAGLPPGLSMNTTTGEITGTVAVGAGQYGPYTVIVSAGDNHSGASQSFTWTILNTLTLTPPPNRTDAEDSTVSFSVSASGSGTIYYGAIGLPEGISINAGTGEISGTLEPDAAADSPYVVTVLASNSSSFADATFVWTVTPGITIVKPDCGCPEEDDEVELQVEASGGSGPLTYSAEGLPTGLSIDEDTGLITGTLESAGLFPVTITATDGTASASTSFDWPVSWCGCFGEITTENVEDQEANAGDAVSWQVEAETTGTGALSYSATDLPTGLSINSSTGLISGTVSSTLAPDIYTAKIVVSDDDNSLTLFVDWTIYPDSAVTLTNPGAQTDDEDGAVSLSLSASYTGSGTLKYSAKGLPPGLVIDPATGDITGTVATGAAAFSPYRVVVTATDGTDNHRQRFTWTVDGLLELDDPGDQSDAEGDIVSLTLDSNWGGTGGWPGTGSPTFSAQGLPPGLVLDPSTGEITGTVAAGAAALGPYAVVAQAAVGDYTSSQTFTWTISNAISISYLADQSDAEGDTVSLSVSATGGGTKSYAATGLPLGLHISPSTGSITGTVATGAAAHGPYSVTVVVTDGTTIETRTFAWEIGNPLSLTTPADQDDEEGDSVSLSLSASGSGTLSYGALGLPPGLVINPTTGAITGTISAGAADNGPYVVTVLVQNGTSNRSTSFSWAVSSPVTVTPPENQSYEVGDSVSLTVDADGGGTLTFSATGLPSGLSLNSGTGAITGTLTTGGSWQTTVTVSNGTYDDVTTFSWDVVGTITITDPGSQTSSEGDTVSLNIEAYNTASGTLSYSATGLPSGLSINSSTGVISGTVGSSAYAGGPYTPTVSVTDGTQTTILRLDWDVLPAGPVVLLNPGSQSNKAGEQLAFFLQAWDTTGATLMYSANGLPPGLYINAFTGLIFGTLSSTSASGTPYAVTVRASNGTVQSVRTFNWTVSAAGTVTMTNPGDQRDDEGDSISLSVSASGSYSLKYVAFGLPAGLAINPTTGSITGTLAAGSADFGPYTVTVVANDGTHSAAQTFAWDVKPALSLTAVDGQAGEEGDSVSLTLSGSGSGTLTYAAFGLPSGLAINASTGAITGTLAAGAGAQGPFTVTVVVSNGTYSESTTFEWEADSPITIEAIDDQLDAEEDAVSLSVSASTTSSGTLNYAAEGLPVGLVINSSTGVISGTIELGTEGEFYPVITVSDGTSSTSVSFAWQVNSAIEIADIADQEHSEGDDVELQVEADGGGTLTYSATGLPAGLSIDADTGLISGTILTGASDIGEYDTVVTVEDGASVTEKAFHWVVTPASSVTLSTPSHQSNTEGDTVSLSLSATGTGTIRYFAIGLPPGLAVNPTTGVIGGTVAVNDADLSPFAIEVIATNGSAFARQRFTWEVSNPITVTVAGQTGTEGDTVALSVTAAGGGTKAYTAVGLPPGLKMNPTTGAVTGTLAVGASSDDPHLVLVTVGDGTFSTSRSIEWGVGGSVTLEFVTPQESLEGDVVSLNLSASGGGSLSYSALGLPAGLLIDSGTGEITGTIAAWASAIGFYSVSVAVSNGSSMASRSFAWMVSNPISISNPGEQWVSAGDSVSFQIQAENAHNTELRYLALGLPLGLSINQETGLVSGQISSSNTAAGAYVSTIQVVDGFSVSRIAVSWNVFSAAFPSTMAGLLSRPSN